MASEFPPISKPSSPRKVLIRSKSEYKPQGIVHSLNIPKNAPDFELPQSGRQRSRYLVGRLVEFRWFFLCRTAIRPKDDDGEGRVKKTSSFLIYAGEAEITVGPSALGSLFRQDRR